VLLYFVSCRCHGDGDYEYDYGIASHDNNSNDYYVAISGAKCSLWVLSVFFSKLAAALLFWNLVLNRWIFADRNDDANSHCLQP